MKNPYRDELILELSNIYESKVYYDQTVISDILSFCFEFYNQRLVTKIRAYDSTELIKQVLFRIEQLQHLERNSEVVQSEEGLIYIIELALENFRFSGKKIGVNESSNIESHAVTCMEYTMAKSSHVTLFGEDSSLELNFNDYDFLIHNANEKLDDCDLWFKSRNLKNIEFRSILDKKHDLTAFAWTQFCDFLNEPFQNEFGLTISNFVLRFIEVIQKYAPITDPGKLPCLHVNQLKDLAKYLQTSYPNILKLHEGLCLTPEIKSSSPRIPYSYTQEVRFRNRPLIKLPFAKSKAFYFSPTFLMRRLATFPENMLLRYNNRIPKEWIKEPIRLEMAKLHTNLGEVWFENLCLEFIQKSGLKAFKPTIKSFPDGPPDILACFDDNSIIFIFECKLLDQEFEPSGIRNHISKFIEKPNEYIPKFIKKVNWATANLTKIKVMFNQNSIDLDLSQVKEINYCFLSYYPAHIEFFHNEIPIPTIFEFVDEFSKSKGKWPFKKGLIKIAL